MTTDQINALLRKALPFRVNAIEAHCFMGCDWFIHLKPNINAVVSKSDNYSNGSMFTLNVHGLIFKSFVHYSFFDSVPLHGSTDIGYIEVNDFNKRRIELVTYAYGRKWTRYLDKV
jgi:hypothetical protein